MMYTLELLSKNKISMYKVTFEDVSESDSGRVAL